MIPARSVLSISPGERCAGEVLFCSSYTCAHTLGALFLTVAVLSALANSPLVTGLRPGLELVS